MMKRFCQECGTEAASDHKVCINCGTRLPAETEVKSKLMTRRQKVIWGIAGIFLVIVIAFSMWANSYQSPESVQKRFTAAVSKKDHSAIQKLLVHEDGSAVSETEAKAFLKLIKQEGKAVASELLTVVQHGKFLWIYDAHKMETVDQFAYYDQPADGLAFHFNGKELAEHSRNEEQVVYGPFAPGVYVIEAVFKGEYGSTTKKDSLTLASSERDYTWIGMELPISKVVFTIDNYYLLDSFDAFILVNDRKVPVDDNGETKELGPFLLDGSQKVKTVIDLPWGEVTSKPSIVDSTHMSVPAAILSKDHYSQVKETLKKYGEEYPKALATKSTEAFSVVTTGLKDRFEDEAFSEDLFYSGSFEELQVDESSISMINDEKNSGISILAQYQFNADYHELSETPELEELVDVYSVELNFNKESNQWLISNWDYARIWGGLEGTDVIEGSKTLQGPSKDAVAKAESAQLNKEMTEFVANYTELSVAAINSRDFSYIEDFITDDGPRRKEASEYIEYLDSKGITEELLGTNVETVELVDETSWKVTSIEEFRIIKPDSSDVKKFRTTILVKRIDNRLLVHELISTKEI